MTFDPGQQKIDDRGGLLRITPCFDKSVSNFPFKEKLLLILNNVE